jgi:hypothetical protein
VKNKIPVSLVIEMSDDDMREWSRTHKCPLADVAKDIQGYVYIGARKLPALAGIIVRSEDV